jgi:hypothetical protein
MFVRSEVLWTMAIKATYYLLRYNSVRSGRSAPKFRRKVLPPSLGSENKPVSCLANWNGEGRSFETPAYFSVSQAKQETCLLKIEAVCFFERSVYLYRTIRCYIPRDSTLHGPYSLFIEYYLAFGSSLSFYLPTYPSVRPCCSHLERMAPMKRLFHFSFLILDSW